jgi:hypothetical protein
MSKLKKEESEKGKKNVELFETLSRSELNFIRGGDDTNTDSDDKK